MGTKDSFVEFTFHREVKKKKGSVCHACAWPRQYLFLELGWQFELKHGVITGPNFTLNTDAVLSFWAQLCYLKFSVTRPALTPLFLFVHSIVCTFLLSMPLFFFQLNFASFSTLPPHSVFIVRSLCLCHWHDSLGTKCDTSHSVPKYSCFCSIRAELASIRIQYLSESLGI